MILTSIQLNLLGFILSGLTIQFCESVVASSGLGQQPQQENLEDNTAQILWELSNLALVNQRNEEPRISFNSESNYYMQAQQNYIANRPSTKPQKYGYYISPYKKYKYRPGYPYQSPYRYPRQQSFMDALSSIAKNDELQCVPRLICEIISGETTTPNRLSGQSNQQVSSLPFVNMDSLMTLIKAFQGSEPSPLLLFGQAVILGYSSQGSSQHCLSSYPKCPRNPDRLVEYLNTHNGGFFRFFGNSQLYRPNQSVRPHYQQPSIYGLNHQYQNQNLRKPQMYQMFQQRIQTKPSYTLSNNDAYSPIPYTHQFPLRNSNAIQPMFGFPKDDKQLSYNEYNGGLTFGHNYSPSIREHRTIGFPEESSRFQTQNYRTMVFPERFPDRTGTGEIKLDTSHLSQVNTGVFYFPSAKHQYRGNVYLDNRY